jgi:hypothetical protein
MSNNFATAWLGWGSAYTPNRKHWHTVPWPSTVRWIGLPQTEAQAQLPGNDHSSPCRLLLVVGWYWNKYPIILWYLRSCLYWTDKNKTNKTENEQKQSEIIVHTHTHPTKRRHFQDVSVFCPGREVNITWRLKKNEEDKVIYEWLQLALYFSHQNIYIKNKRHFWVRPTLSKWKIITLIRVVKSVSSADCGRSTLRWDQSADSETYNKTNLLLFTDQRRDSVELQRTQICIS